MDFFAIKQRLVKGGGAELWPALRGAHIGLIEMRSDNPGWVPNLLIPAIRQHYRAIYVAEGYELLVPKGQR